MRIGRIALATVVLISIAFGGAQRTLTMEGLPTLTDVVREEAQVTANWIGAYALVSQDWAPQQPVAVSNRVLSETFTTTGKEREFLSAFRERVALALRDLTRMGGTEVGMVTGDGPPARFFAHNGGLGVLISGLGVDINFNENELDQRQRFYRVFMEMVLPELSALDGAFGDTSVRFGGISVTYGVRDFTSSIERGAPEALIVVLPMATVADYEELRIADADLLYDAILFGGAPNAVRQVSYY